MATQSFVLVDLDKLVENATGLAKRSDGWEPK